MRKFGENTRNIQVRKFARPGFVTVKPRESTARRFTVTKVRNIAAIGQ